MRISDWSSDVCSSDLSDADIDHFDKALTDYGLTVEHIEAGVYPKSGRRVQFQLPSGHIMQIYAQKDQIGNGMPLRNPGTIPDEGYIRGMRSRSEEQTSEIKSLMRTSYDVF